jgi:uncharacterized protein
MYAEKMASVVCENEGEQRFEIRLDGELVGVLSYRRHASRIALIHTEIDRQFQGRGLAAKLIGSALDAAEAQGLEVLPVCPFVQDYIRGHPEYLELVPAARRAHFKFLSDSK